MRLLPALALLLAASPAYADTITGRVDRVTDGDTMTVAGTKIRMHGIDAPESKQECDGADGKPYPCGERARLALEAMALGREVACRVTDTDRYGRTVAQCSAGGTDLNERMVRTGNAVDYRRYSKGAYSSAEAQARADKLGIWSGRFTMPDEWRRERRER